MATLPALANLPPEPVVDRAADDAGVVAILEGRWRLQGLARRHVARHADLARLEERLRDPCLKTHPKRPAALARWRALKAEFADLEAAVDAALAELGRQWDRLSWQGRGDLVVSPQARNQRGVDWSRALWGDLLDFAATHQWVDDVPF